MTINQYVFPDWWDYLIQKFQELIVWFSSLDLIAQIFAGIGIFLLFFLAWGIMYGIFQFALEVVKFTLIVILIAHYLVFLGFKLSIVAIASPNEVKNQWEYGVNNIKWVIQRAYPKEYLKSEQFIQRHVTFHKPNPEPKPESQVVIVKSDTKLHCTNCGVPFSGRMQQLAKSRNYVYCENCGQVFILHET
ncbi:MAG: hypothetical protein JW776_13655 [Candidatus Lokiarchaeota archaeon]|nr:hypothetical protein [Candidatus Lokiarchaeota archaeon]